MANNIARWDGSSWSALGSGVNGYVTALAMLGNDLFVGGGFTTAGGIAATNDTMYFLFSGPALIPRLGTASLVTSVVIVFLVSILSALYPAALAMRVTPLEAMQSDD